MPRKIGPFAWVAHSLVKYVSVFRLAPPLTVLKEEIEEGLRILDDAFAFVLILRSFMADSD